MNKAVVLDVCKHQETEAQTFVLRQWDRRSLTLDIAVTEDGEPFDLINYEARFMCALVDERERVIIEPCQRTGSNTLSYTIPGILTQKPGVINLAYIAFYQDDEWIASTECLTFIIQKGVDIPMTEALSWIPEFEKLKRRLDEIVADCNQKQTNLYQQIDEQQEAWQQQLNQQQSSFEEAEIARNDAEKARQEAEIERNEQVAAAIEAVLAYDSITNEEIDSLWDAH